MATLYFDGDKRRIYEVPTTASFTVDGDGYRLYTGPGESDSRMTGTYLWSKYVDWIAANNWSAKAFAKTGGAYRFTIDGDDVYATFDLRLINGWALVRANYPHNWTIEANLFPNESNEVFDATRITANGGLTRIFSADSLQVIKSAGSVDLSDLYVAAYGGAVSVDVNSGITGTVFPKGTAANPVNNLSDALLIASSFGLKRINLVSDLTLTGSLTDIEISGRNSNVLDLNGQALTNVSIRGLSVTGAMTGSVEMFDASLSAVSGLNGTMNRCRIDGALGVAASGMLRAVDCVSYDGAVITTGANSIATFNRLSGSAQLAGVTAGAIVYMGLDQGYIDLAASCTGGVFTLSGTGHLQDSSAGMTVVSTGFVSDPSAKLRYKMAFVYDNGTWDEV